MIRHWPCPLCPPVLSPRPQPFLRQFSSFVRALSISSFSDTSASPRHFIRDTDARSVCLANPFPCTLSPHLGSASVPALRDLLHAYPAATVPAVHRNRRGLGRGARRTCPLFLPFRPPLLARADACFEQCACGRATALFSRGGTLIPERVTKRVRGSDPLSLLRSIPSRLSHDTDSCIPHFPVLIIVSAF